MPDFFSIGLLTHSVNPRGGVVHTLELAEALRLCGHRVTVMATARPGQQFFRPVASEVALIELPDTIQPDMVQEVGIRIDRTEQYVRQRVARQPFDILHTQDPIGGNALANLRNQGLIPHFVRTVHHLDHFSEPQLDAWQTRGWRAADRVLCVSALWQERLLEEHGQESGLVHNGVDAKRYAPQHQPDDEALRQRLGIRPDGRIVLSIGGIEERKNTTRLLDAFIRLRRQIPDAQLVIAGGSSLLDHSGEARDFQALLTRHGITPGPGQPVLVAGSLPDTDIPGLMRLADVLAMPSVREGFGLVVLEALACGTPVVVSRIRPFTDYLEPADACWADPGSPDAIAQALRQTLTAPRAAQAAQVAATAVRLIAHYSWDASARQHLAHYARLLGAEPSPL